jgi:hypothetical protein
MPGLGLEPRCPEGHPILSRARLTSFATPAVLVESRDAQLYEPGVSVLAGNRSGPWNWYASKNAA